MKPTTKIILTIGLTLFIFSCSSDRQEEMEARDYSSSKQELSLSDTTDGQASATEKTINGFISSSAAVETGKDTTRKFIRTAEMKFRVDNVAKRTYQIEDLIVKFDGFVTYTNLSSDIDRRDMTAMSADSSLETIYFTVSNSMVLRVPNTKLDSTLKSIATLIDYLDYRVIKANDVSLSLFANKMTQERMKKPETQRTTVIENADKKVLETRQSEENLLRKQEQTDEAKLSNLSLTDQINFSTINLDIYQRQEIKRWLIANDKNIDEYEPSFGAKLIESIKYGWDILESFIVFLTKLWGLILFAIVVYVLYKKFGHKLKITNDKK